MTPPYRAGKDPRKPLDGTDSSEMLDYKVTVYIQKKIYQNSKGFLVKILDLVERLI